MKIYIPTYKRGETQKTLNTLSKIGYPMEEVYLIVQDDKEGGYKKYEEVCNVVYRDGVGIARNRNNVLDIADDKFVMMDDNIEAFFVYKDNKMQRIKDATTLNDCFDRAFGYCDENNAKTWCLRQMTNMFYLSQKAKKCAYNINGIGGVVFGIEKNGIRFDEELQTKEDYGYILEQMKNGYNVVLLNEFGLKKAWHSDGGCQDVHTYEVEVETAKKLVEKYPELCEMKNGSDTEIKMSNVCEQSYSSPRWTGEIADCTLPVTFDTYSNCSFGCVYCFSQYQRGVGASKGDYLAKKVKSVNPDDVIRLFKGEDKENQFYPYIKTKRPIQWGGLSDQFDGFEKKYGVTYKILKYLREINYPISFSTKSAWVFKDPKYQEIFKGADNWNMKFSIITLDEKDAAKIEQGVASPQERLEAMRIYNSLSKGGTTLRLRPFIVGVSDKTYLDLIRAAKDAGATAVTTEFFCLEERSARKAKKNYDIISECAGFDIVDFYKKYSVGTGYLRLNRKVKEKYIKKMRELCHSLGMRFYVSDAHYKECCDNCSCCALPPQWNYSRGNFSAALQIAKKTGEVRWSDIEGDMYFLEFPYVRAQGFNTNSAENRDRFMGMTMKEYLRYIWNNPKRGQSPYKLFERVLLPDGYDENGDVIYKYNQNVTFEECKNQILSKEDKLRV